MKCFTEFTPGISLKSLNLFWSYTVKIWCGMGIKKLQVSCTFKFAYLRSFVCLRIGMNSVYIDYTHDKVFLISDYGKCTSRNSPRTFGTHLVHIR